MKNNTKWKAFNIAMPEELIPLYDFLQQELDWFLSDTTTRAQLEKINLKQHKGRVWIDFKNNFTSRIKKWSIHNKAWHANILYENLRRELASKQEAIIIYKELQTTNTLIEVKENLISKHKIYATAGQIRNVQRMKHQPELAYNAVFQLDYTVSNKQFFRMISDNICQIKISKTEWIDYQILLPASLDQRLTGVIAKPRFLKRKRDGKYIGICSYEYETETMSGKNILGVDIGKIKLFSAVVLKPDNSYSDEFIESKYCRGLKNKLERLYESRKLLLGIVERADFFEVGSLRQARRKVELGELGRKISRVKLELAKRVALEVVFLARSKECGEIHLENLSWLDSKGGKWNHSEVLSLIELKASEFGIKTVRVNAAFSSSTHPETGERGRVVGRVVKFAAGSVVDRDVLAAINIALRSKKIVRKVRLRESFGQARVRVSCSRRREVKRLVAEVKSKNNNGGMEMVVFSLGVLRGSLVEAQSFSEVLPINSLLCKTISDN